MDTNPKPPDPEPSIENVAESLDEAISQPDTGKNAHAEKPDLPKSDVQSVVLGIGDVVLFILGIGIIGPLEQYFEDIGVHLSPRWWNLVGLTMCELAVAHAVYRYMNSRKWIPWVIFLPVAITQCGLLIGNPPKEIADPTPRPERPELTRWQPPELPMDSTNITCYFGGFVMSFTIGTEQLRTNTSKQPFRTDHNLHDLPFRPFIEDNRLYVEVDSAMGKAVIRMDDSTRIALNRSRESWDWNFNSNQYEMVRTSTGKGQRSPVPVLQVSYLAANEIMIKGLLQWETHDMMIAISDRMNVVSGITNWADQLPASPVFKYPSLSHQGKLAE